MAASAIDREIDALYQLPPDEFTSARNDLAKRASGDDKARIRALKKPTAPAWAVNQLYWKGRPDWDALVRAAGELRAAHRSALTGKAVDLRKADAAHREALARAVKRAMDLVTAAGHAPASALKDAVVRTLQALPAEFDAGRLDAPLESAGFGLLGGITPAPAVSTRPTTRPKTVEAPPTSRTKSGDDDPRVERERAAAARAAQREAERAEREARAEAERQRREDEKRAAQKAREIAQLTAAVDRAREREADLRARLADATREREAAEKTLQRAR